jgi:hypothetical protein
LAARTNETLAATRDERANRDLLSGIVQGRASRFLSTDFIFRPVGLDP